MRAGVSDERRGTRYTITGTVRVDDVKGAPNALVRAIHPDDGQALYAPRQSATKPARFQRRALRHLFVVLAATAKDRFVDALRLHAPIKPARKRFAGLVRLHDPLIADRAAFSLDLMFEWPEAGKTLPLDLTLGPPGLVIPAGGSLVLDRRAQCPTHLSAARSRCCWKCGAPVRRRISASHTWCARIDHRLWPAIARTQRL